MALNVTALEDVKSADQKIMLAQEKYDTALKKIKDLIAQSEASWNSPAAKDEREKVNKAINNELTHRKEEMLAQSKFLKDTTNILQESQEEIKNTLA